MNCPKCGAANTWISDWVMNEENEEVGVGTSCNVCGYRSYSDEEDDAALRGEPWEEAAG